MCDGKVKLCNTNKYQYHSFFNTHPHVPVKSLVHKGGRLACSTTWAQQGEHITRSSQHESGGINKIIHTLK